MPSRAVHWAWPGLVERCQFGSGYMMSGLLRPVPLFGPLLSAFLHAGPHIAPMHAEIRTFRRQVGNSVDSAIPAEQQHDEIARATAASYSDRRAGDFSPSERASVIGQCRRRW